MIELSVAALIKGLERIPSRHLSHVIERLTILSKNALSQRRLANHRYANLAHSRLGHADGLATAAVYHRVLADRHPAKVELLSFHQAARSRAQVNSRLSRRAQRQLERGLVTWIDGLDLPDEPRRVPALEHLRLGP